MIPTIMADDTSLYDFLATAVPAAARAGETRITATKEKLHDDGEDLPDDDVIITRGG